MCFYCATQICIARTSYGNVARLVGGWVSVTVATVSKRLNPENFFDHLVAPS